MVQTELQRVNIARQFVHETLNGKRISVHSNAAPNARFERQFALPHRCLMVWNGVRNPRTVSRGNKIGAQNRDCQRR